jgi:hypothetical protein
MRFSIRAVSMFARQRATAHPGRCCLRERREIPSTAAAQPVARKHPPPCAAAFDGHCGRVFAQPTVRTAWPITRLAAVAALAGWVKLRR